MFRPKPIIFPINQDIFDTIVQLKTLAVDLDTVQQIDFKSKGKEILSATYYVENYGISLQKRSEFRTKVKDFMQSEITNPSQVKDIKDGLEAMASILTRRINREVQNASRIVELTNRLMSIEPYKSVIGQIRCEEESEKMDLSSRPSFT